MIPVITIDGSSGVGKGTVAIALAQHLGWHLLDSGALYRLLALAANQHAIALDNADSLADLASQLNIEFQIHDNEVQAYLDGDNVQIQLRSEETGKQASLLAVHTAVRAALLQRQRDYRQAPGLVADGRDMGSVVFSNAAHKFFLTASPHERAKRRYKQLKQKGIDATLATLEEMLIARDERDSQRAASPLVAAADALVIDTSNLSIEAVLKQVLNTIIA